MGKKIFIRHNGRYIGLNFSDIIFIEGLRNYIKIHCCDRSYLILMTLKKMAEILPQNGFQRIHKSYIISLDHLTEFNYDTIWMGKINLPVGEQFRKALLSKVLVANEEIEETEIENLVIPFDGKNIGRLNGMVAL